MRWDYATLDINPVFPGIKEIIIIIITAVIIIIIIIIICIDKDSKIFELLSKMVGQMTASF